MIRVLVVDDSAVVRRLVTTALGEADDIEVAGVARDGLEAIDQVNALVPDVVILDIEMPRLDGLGAVVAIREDHPRLPIIMFSTLTERGATATLEALSRGASDYVTKPSNSVGGVTEGITAVREQLVPRIRALAGRRRLAAGLGPRPAVVRTAPPAPEPRRTASGPPEVLLIGSSTGGPDALAQVLPALPGSLPVPVLVVQHMPPVFTAMLAQRLDRECALTVREAVDGEVVRAGEVLIAPGDFHLRVVRAVDGSVVTRLDQGPQENFCRPAVDVLFRSAHEVYGGRALATVLTGMGQDGLEGCRPLAASGARVLVQDEASSVVWGMPGAVSIAGLADETLPLGDIAMRITAGLRPRLAAVQP
ncbi:protein-glutamate methylesterase/protein-glutamine glutaminase [Nocardioides stalactiti]|uniref:protein-glutamate methylesterase/protein-glutamine glutaminase n=1 Tax=Nocardioides stalactiti TaxID=2755356 RepID=UPI001602710D|nr:chemotaxis response regulator protein-glutamate methylesterase [Nocardioides stalactiti]